MTCRRWWYHSRRAPAEKRAMDQIGLSMRIILAVLATWRVTHHSSARQRGRPGRCDRQIPCAAGAKLGRQAHGMLQLPEPLDRGSSGAFRDSAISRLVVRLAGSFRRRLPARATRSRAAGDGTGFTTFGRRHVPCAAVRNDRNCGAVQLLQRRGPPYQQRLVATSKLGRKRRCPRPRRTRRTTPSIRRCKPRIVRHRSRPPMLR